MPCILCLKEKNGKYRRIEFASTKAEELDIKAIIDFHFWRQKKNAPEACKYICKPCWNCLSTFHKFYLTIENAYKDLNTEVAQCNVKEEMVEPPNRCINLTEIEYIQPRKRKRDKPLQTNIDVFVPLYEDIDKDNRALLEDVSNDVKLKEIKVEPPEPDVTMTDELDTDIIPEQLVETAYSDILEDSEDKRKKAPHLRQSKSKRTTKKSLPIKTVKSTEEISSKMPLTCDICDAPIKDLSNYSLHNKMMHKDERFKKRTCTICSKFSPNYEALQAHIKYSHFTERTHKCTECDKAFKLPLGLREHMATHTGKRLYTCPYCPRTFNYSANMHSHKKKKHRAEWEANRRCWVFLGDPSQLETSESES